MNLLTNLFLAYLRLFAILQIKKLHLFSKLTKQNFTIVAVTGSAGKTSTVQAAYAALTPNFKVKTNNNYNSQFGLPANILGIKLDGYSKLSWLFALLKIPFQLFFYNTLPQIYLVEMDVDGPHEPENITYLLKIISPDIAIHLNVGSVHTMNFDPLIPTSLSGQKRLDFAKQLMCNEQSVLTRSLPADKIAILNLSDPLVASTSSNIKAKIVPIQNFDRNLVAASSYFLPEIYDITFGAALTLAKVLGLDTQVAQNNLKHNFSLPPGRASVFKGIHNSTIIDSSYNSSPDATSEFIKALSLQKGPKLAILGDMRELGEQSKTEHIHLAKLALASADKIITVGPLTKKYFPPDKNIQKFDYWWQALEYIHRHPEHIEGSTILIKGSQNTIYLEELVKGLLANSEDASKLCRQSPYWLDLKGKFRKNNP